MTQPAPRTVRFLLHHHSQNKGFREFLGATLPASSFAAPNLDVRILVGSAPLTLTMLWIPPGRFWMGSPPTEPEHLDSESPQHLVQLQGFFMSQTPITQAQWREVAGWQEQPGEGWGKEIKTDPFLSQIKEPFLKRESNTKGAENTDDTGEDLEASGREENNSLILNLVDRILIEAIMMKASDIHMEPQDDRLLIRFRMDGVLRDIESLPKKITPAVTARVKIMADLDISERRLPQDGRIRRSYRGRSIDFRISTLPTRHGEKFVIRLPDNIATDQRPVENVNWVDVMEFCHRLSQRTGRFYTLPSEAQWEYACRAGTTTPFHFGGTISPELANYDGNHAYADGPKGIYRKQTTPVGMFSANAWGLHDMHGNVWEWCLDEWHDSYDGAPTDGRASVDAAEGQKSKEPAKPKLLRGGSWSLKPGDCRSAVRTHARPDVANYDVGFRVVCLPQDPSLNS
jgi:formylglycine-generating enzyme required for sulfatase activity